MVRNKVVQAELTNPTSPLHRLQAVKFNAVKLY